ncbi:hypothetical protein ABFS82_10G030600 [Erythranthe guttata]|uniref:Uncharacterized protein n=1 Tax=Erythranthe guttata TaxID=4155 RepID=A0A022RNU4_ERYGU|nr:hypothetical protein MIMGU_mgv1a017460mg [Erythranthe guttata]
MEAEQGCTTPKNQEYQIQVGMACPPPPRKKKIDRRTKRDPPKNGYFQSPELDIFFGGAAAHHQGRELAWAAQV